MSDTHDRMPLIIKTIDILNRLDVELVIHCGDYCAPFSIEPYIALKHSMVGIYGNNDAERALIASKLKQYGKEIKGEFLKIKFGDTSVAVLHGHDTRLLEAIMEFDGLDIVIYGHTHEPRIEYCDGKLILNPGEVCGYLTDKSTIAVLDTESLKAELVHIL